MVAMVGARQTLAGARILVLEDSFAVADEIRGVVEDGGGRVVGPVAALDRALEALRESEVDGAVLDVEIRGEPSFGVAEEMRRRGLPFLFVSGYGDPDLPETLARAPCLAKPFEPAALVAMLTFVLETAGRHPA